MAIFKVAASKSDLPVDWNWLALDADGMSVPSDWYLRLAGKAQSMLGLEIDHLSSTSSELAAPLGWQTSGLSQDSTLTQILSNGVLALDNANTNKSL